MKSETITIQSRFGVVVHNTLLSNDSTKLLILLPGRGYTVDYPLFYYLRRTALHQGYDVLSVQYGFQIANMEMDAAKTPLLVPDVLDTIQPVLGRGYEQVCIAGKSLGTPIAAEVARSLLPRDVALLMLTPIGGALQGLGQLPALAVIGTADALYSSEEVAAYTGHPSIRWHVFDGLNHSLEVPDDWQASLRVLPEIIGVCAAFLR